MMRGLIVLACTVLAVCIMTIIVLWIYRYIQYRKTLKQSKWRTFYHQTNSSYNQEDTERPYHELALEWPSSKSLYLSPIPEGIEGRESMESRKSRVTSSSSSPFIVKYGSFEHVTPSNSTTSTSDSPFRQIIA